MRRAAATMSYGFRKLLPPLSFQGLKVSMTGDHVSRGVWKRVFRGDYEKPELDALLALLRPDDRLLELGAGMGLVSGVVAKKFPKLTVESFEANTAMISVIHDLHERNAIGNVRLNNAVLVHGETGRPRDFHLATSFAVGSLLKNGSSTTTVQVAERDVSTVLSTFRPNVLLCDIEGGEAELFPGLDLSGLRAAVVELHPAVIGRQAEAEIYSSFAAAGLFPRIELCSGTVVAFEAVAR